MTRADVGEWRLHAACRGKPIDLFYGQRWQSQAIDVCCGCPVRAECLEWALYERIDHGVLGGVSERGRRRLLRQRRQREKEMAA